jgi:hypothetical protein
MDHQPTARGVLPDTERGQDPAREAYERGLTDEPSRPLTDDERDVERYEAEHENPARDERVYAPASARTPKEPMEGDREIIEHDEPRV